MPEKRGRPPSTDSSNAALVRRRQRNREVMRALRQRQRAESAVGTVEQSAERSQVQLAQGERIVNFSLTEEEEAAVTLTQLGLRVQGVTLAQDFGDALEQPAAVPVDEHDSLYNDDTGAARTITTRPPPPVGFFRRFARKANSPRVDAGDSSGAMATPRQTVQDQRPLSEFFQSRPPRQEQWSMQAGVALAPSVSPRLSEPLFCSASPPLADEHPDNTQPDVERPDMSHLSLPTFEPTRVDEPEPSDHESVVQFASQDSSGEESTEAVDEIPPLEYMAQKLFDQLAGGFHGCTAEEHDIHRREHIQAARENHYGLGEVFNDAGFPSVLELNETITAERLARQENPTPQQWKEMFCGTSRRTQERLPKNVCLHKEQTQAVECQVIFDIDSFLGFATSLAMARKGLWYQPVPLVKQNILADNHLEIPVFAVDEEDEGERRPARTRLVMLRDVPHFLLGRVVGSHDITVHVLFPHMPVGREKFVGLTHEQLRRWVDDVYMPVLHKFYDAHYMQHLPASFRHAFANSKAHQVEARQVETASYQVQQSIGYHLQPEHLDSIWTKIIETVASTPGLADFREPQLFFSAKGTKLQFKANHVRPTLAHAMDYFQTFFEDVVHPDFVELDRLYVDIGKEICPRVSYQPAATLHVGEEPQVYAWKRCCLEQYLRWMYDDQPPRVGKGQNYFGQNMLYEACGMTSVTARRSRHREGGLIYSQFYASVKEITDATKCFPFSNDGMEEMALDPHIRRGARHAAGGRRRDGRVVERAYLASKRRTREALSDSRHKSFGIREEHRVTWALFQALRQRLHPEESGAHVDTLEDCPPYAWAIRTAVYVDYLWRSADKFATGFEVVRARCRPDMVTWEETKMMAMFLRCLRFVFGGHLLSRESALWWSRRDRLVGPGAQPRRWYGLGFCNTLPRYKYCWLEPRVDWQRLCFQEPITDAVLFGNNMLRGQYLRRGGQVSAFFDMTQRLEVALRWLAQYPDVERVQTRMLLWIIHLCLWQFRLDVLGCVRAEMSAAHREAAMKGLQGFCQEHFEEIMQHGVYFMSGNRCDFKQATELGHFLFDADDGRIRNHWEDRPFRKLYQRALTRVQLCGAGVAATFQRRFWRALYQYHWVLPYPCTEGLLQTTKQGRRMWYSIRTAQDARVAETGSWEWARKNWQAGRPRELPQWLQWSKDEWQAWVGRR